LERESSIGLVRAVAIELDAVLADTRQLWRDWLEDAARRARVPLDDLPEDRRVAAVILDERLGDWRPLLERFAADRGPIHFRPRPEVSAVLRRLQGEGARVGVFTDAPVELASLALAHTGAARRVEAVGSLDEVRERLGADAIVVRSRAELAALQ
jgi:phosphoglycolate phosphatase-like HAD superfamily hydrolase